MASPGEALISALRNDATFAALSPGGVWGVRTPQRTTAGVYANVTLESGDDIYAQTQRAWDVRIFRVECRERSTSPTNAQSAAERADAVLTDGSLTATGFRVQSCRRITPVEDVEPDGDYDIQVRGGLYELWAAPA